MIQRYIILKLKIEVFFARQIDTDMSSPQEYHYTAQPSMPHCQGSSCYCFHATNQMDANYSDSDSDSDVDSIACELQISSSEWHIETDSDWTIALNEMKFRHPRVLLAYFRFVSFTNEIAKSRQEYISIPPIPKDVKQYILNHSSFKETPSEFQEEVNNLHAWVELLSSKD